MRDYITNLGNEIFESVQPYVGNRDIVGRAADGDVHFRIDEVAEEAMEKALDKLEREGLKFAYLSEKEGEVILMSKNPEYLFLIDPIDGSRPAKSGFPQWCVNLAVAPYSEKPTVGDVKYAFMKEADGTEYYSERGRGTALNFDGKEFGPLPSQKTSIDGSSLIIEVCGNEQSVANIIYTPLLRKSWPQGVFVVSSSSWSVGQLVSGRIDGYIHLAKRIFEEFPEYRDVILHDSGGKLKALLPYDIAPWKLVGEESGLTITDTHGNSLDDMSLTDIGQENQRCVIGTGTKEFHDYLKDTVDEGIEFIKDNPDILEKLMKR